MYMNNEFILETQDKGKDIGSRDWKNEVLKDVSDWLDKNFYNKIDMYSDYSFDITGLNSNFISKEQMLQSFKEHFNISE